MEYFKILLAWLVLFTTNYAIYCQNHSTDIDAIDDHTSQPENQCSNTIITDRKGIIHSPLYPKNYPDHVSCTWHIIGNIGEVITITFQDLDIAESELCDELPCCVYSWIKIGPVLNGSDWKYCGQDSSYLPTFVSNTPKVWIKFHASNVHSGGRGFKLLYTVEPRRGKPCHEDEFKCNELECVPMSTRCNGFRDCNDGSDEQFCSDHCPSGNSCESAFLCYDNHRRCDGIPDCPDFSDELGCGVCMANETRCGLHSMQCYNPFTERCNRIMDCMNGEDEKDCIHVCPGKIVCASGTGCYSMEERCNGVVQCADSSDEKNCSADLCNYDRGGFLCSNGTCIRQIWKCDHTNDCGDGSDEYNCLRNSVLTAAVMGSLICALLLVIALSCTYRLYAMNASENRILNHEPVLSCISQDYIFREPPPSYAMAVGERFRNLCVENVHYNSCPRRSRRRTRRARRNLDHRRASNSDSTRNPNMHPPFTFMHPTLYSSTVPGMAESLPNLAALQSGSTSNSTTSRPLERNECSDNYTPTVHRQKTGDVKPVDQSINLSTDAESSFSELSLSPTKIEDSDTNGTDTICTETFLGQNENVDRSLLDLNSTYSCDIDTHPLIP